MKSSATTAEEYLASLPEDRRAPLEAVRKVILKNLPRGYVECMGWGMITYAIPLARFADTYNGHPLGIAALSSQKNYMAVYLMNIYAEEKIRKWFLAEYKKSGKKLDAGKCCIRFRKLDDLPLEVIGKAVKMTPVEQLIEWHELAHRHRLKVTTSVKKKGPAAKRHKKK